MKLYLVLKLNFVNVSDNGYMSLKTSLKLLEKVIKHFEKRVLGWIKNIGN